MFYSFSSLLFQLQLDSVVKGLLRRRKLNFLSALRAELMTFTKVHVKDVSDKPIT